MTRHIVGASCLLASLLVAVPGASQERAPEPRWGLEVIFGSAAIDPAHLNAFSRHREAVYAADPDVLSRYYSGIYGPGISLTASSDGELPVLERSWTGGLRASRRLGRRVTVVAGFEYLSRSRASSLDSAWQVTYYNPNAVSFPTTTGQAAELSVRLSAASYSPSLGLRWTLWSPRSLKLEATAAGGPTYGTCVIEQRATLTTPFYRQSSTTAGRMEGSGWHVAAEGGLRVSWSAARRWGAAVEATYRYERFPNVTGTERFASTRQDGDAATPESESETNVSGRWRLVPYQATVLGRRVNQPYPAIATDQPSAFALDLSGVRLRAGVTLRFGHAGAR